MEQIYLTGLKILKVRHLEGIEIPLSKERRRHLILTGKNGSGKTSVLKSLAEHLAYLVSGDYLPEEEILSYMEHPKHELEHADASVRGLRQKEEAQKMIKYWEKRIQPWQNGCLAQLDSPTALRESYQQGRFILACYDDDRKVNITPYKNIEKVDLKEVYSLSDHPSRDLGKYLASLKSTQAFAQIGGHRKRQKEIKEWFLRFEKNLRRIYHDESLELVFDIDTFQFSIHLDGREPFSFDQMSMGYAAVFDIVSDLIMRMESQCRKGQYDLEGIVLIDEVETHLHVSLQKEIVPILTDLFPNIQFILTTHSPFVLSSTPDAVVYDLESGVLVEDGLTSLPYDGIVEGYFEVDLLSKELREQFEEYKRLSATATTPLDEARLFELETVLDEIPDYLAVDFSEEYQRIRTEREARG